MKIVVVGCGKIGSAILASLVSEGHDVTAVDNSASVIAEITNVHDVMAVCGNGADYETLEEAGVDKAEMFVAVTGSDEMNMLSCFFAKKMGAKHTIARIRNPEYNDQSLSFMRQQLELSMSINPELLAAQEFFNVLKLPSAAKIENFSRRNMEMIEIRLSEDSPLNGVKLSKMREMYKANYLVCCVQRGDDVFIPGGNSELKSGDKVGLTGSPAEVLKLLKLLGVQHKQAKRIMIIGGSKTAFYLAKMLTASGNDVKIIDRNEERCRTLSRELPKAVVINGDGAKQELLQEEGLADQDAFVALTGVDEENILLSIFASMNNMPKVILKVNRSELAEMAKKTGLDSIVSTREITSNIIVRFARALENSMDSNVETLYKLMDGKAEALEFIVHQDSQLTNVPIRDLDLHRDVLIAGIMRGRKTIIPSGDDMILSDDRVVVITAGRRIQNLSDIIK